jgi:serine/threonine-protein kinase
VNPEALSAALADRYTIERELGAGGMATVYLAHDVKHDRKVAIKVLRPELAAVIGAERFLREIKTIATLQHPHILGLIDSGEVNGTAYYVMPFVDGESLRDRLIREKQLPINDAIRLATAVAGALDYAHRHGVIHRDIKPENILLHDGAALVADFGIALAVSSAGGGARMTETGMSLGTPHYMSPEQAMGEREITPRSDVYALGAMTYEMLIGDPPFTGSTAQAIIAKVMTSEPVSLIAQRKSVPPAVNEAVLTALEKLPADRFASAAEFASALSNTATATRARAHAAAPVSSRMRHAAIPLLAGIGVGAAVLWLSGAGRTEQRALETPVRFTLQASPGTTLIDQSHMAISADGKFFIYAADRNGATALYRRDLDDPEPKLLAGTDGAIFPAISPDGRSLAFDAKDGSLSTMRLDGSRPVVLKTTTNPPIGIGWGRDHRLILGMLAYSATAQGLSWIGESGDSVIHRLNAVSGRMFHEPLVLDSAGIALYHDIDIRTGATVLGIASIRDGAATNVDLPLRQIFGIADGVLVFVAPGGDLMAVRFDATNRRLVGTPIAVATPRCAVRNGVLAPTGTMVVQCLASTSYQLVLVDDHGIGKPLLSDTLQDVVARFSPDGKRVAAGILEAGESRTEIFDLAGQSHATVARQAWSSTEWTPDGRRLLLVSGPARQVFALPVDGSDSAKAILTRPEYELLSAVPSADSRVVALGTVFDTGGRNVVTTSLDSGAALLPFAAGPADEVAPRFSPDGRWLAYASDESGRFEVYVKPFPGPGPRIQLSDSGGGQPVWSRDGSQLFYRNSTALMAIQLARTADGSLRVGGRRRLFDGDFLGGADAETAQYDVSPDGRSFLIARATGGEESRLEVWLHWLAGVKAQLQLKQ